MGSSNKLVVETIIAGGQTGADRAGLDWAIKHGFRHGGWCPKGRLAEDGPIAVKYALNQTPTKEYKQRTEWNVRDSDGTVIFSIGNDLAGGSLITLEMAAKYHKPHLWLRSAEASEASIKLRNWLRSYKIRILNVAGPRRSEEPQIAQFVERVLEETFAEVRIGRQELGNRTKSQI